MNTFSGGCYIYIYVLYVLYMRSTVCGINLDLKISLIWVCPRMGDTSIHSHFSQKQMNKQYC